MIEIGGYPGTWDIGPESGKGLALKKCSSHFAGASYGPVLNADKSG